MNINENFRNKRKLVENVKVYAYNITRMSATYYSKLPKLNPNKSGVIVL